MLPIVHNLYIHKAGDSSDKKLTSKKEDFIEIKPKASSNPSLLQPRYPNEKKPPKPTIKPKPPNNPSLLQPLESKK